MSASWPGNMRVPRLKTPLLLLLLLLVTSLTATAQDYETSDQAPEYTEEEEGPVGDDVEEPVNEEPLEVQTTPETSPTSDIPESETQSETETGSGTPDYTSTPVTDWTSATPEDGELSFIIILIPVVLVVLIIGLIVCGIFINRRWKKSGRSHDLTKEDPYLDGSSTEKVPMPMFEEDVPSVLELEMEEFDQLMKKDGDTAENSTNA